MLFRSTTNWNGSVDIDDDTHDQLAEELANKRAPVDEATDDGGAAAVSTPSSGSFPVGPVVGALALGGVMTTAFIVLRRGSGRRPARA